MDVKVRVSRVEYWQEILDLYRRVAFIPGGLSRSPDEVSVEYVRDFLKKSHESGVSLIAFSGMQIVGEVHAFKLNPKVFSHVLSELTVVVDPNFIGKGVGKALFLAFLAEVRSNRPDILRVELIARESNAKAIQLYGSLGFQQEGRMEKRINSGKGHFEADIPMAWINPNFRLSEEA
ncbi:GNAT family N-acetyltransferase [Algoriphagus aestuariicola]|uniref:GNAT family N-acetyltransferase n=1 Tax=Algoriphagus aestuariicola TaxID=1852016 RepID=A0ABS3BPS2_9BACT|nr:GNAT family N-acetyltransferase [Algoriphagus aestuariicola]MBN7801294.1 GNAT family N-acetyltransferase [Algoriphagus aestuariicola]